MSSLNITTERLESSMKDRIDQLVEKPKTETVSEKDGTDIQRLQEILGAIYQSERILSEAGTALRKTSALLATMLQAMLSSLQFRRTARLFMVK
jgi:hypothetical protein